MADRDDGAPAATLAPDRGRPPAPGRRSTAAWARTLAWVLPAILALVLSLLRSARTPPWRDEYATWVHASLDLPDLLDAAGRVDAVFGPYYLLMHALAPALPADLAWLRLPSVLSFVAATAMVGLLASRWWGSGAALAAGLAFAVNPALLVQATNARPYAVSVMFVVAAVLAIELAASRPGRWWGWAAASLAGVLAVAMHLFAVVPLAATAVLIIGRARSWRPWALAALPSLAVAVAIGIVGSGQRGQLTWLSAPDLREAIRILADAAGVSSSRAVVFDALLLGVLAAAFAATVIAVGRPIGRETAELRPLVFSVTLLAGPWLALSIGSWLVAPMLTERYMLWSAAGAALVIGAAVGAWARRRTPAAIAAGVLATALVVVGAVFSFERLAALEALESRPGALEQAVDDLREEAEPGDRVALVQRYWEGGVAAEFAAAAGDQAHVDEIVGRLPDAGQPLMEVRRIVTTDPFRTEADATPPQPGDAVWLVTLVPLDDADRAGLDPRLAECLTGLPVEDAAKYDAFHVWRATCGSE